ncbi:MAG: class II D-tagatose-bisphosphate aldolase, non-catalytic subunit [Lachnospiraceae bacterium]|nr:class II D-tagatose-bisphosphate aldolase, non-catalytic subunit [Lachnospiraceae bacterium]
MKHPIREMVAKRQVGIHCGIPSFCCASKLVIEAILEQAKRFDDTVLIEATSNQVNQYGGYTNMQPEDFKNFVYQIADKIEFSRDKVVLGGDHLGPLPWADLPAEEAMEQAIKLVRLTIAAGYTKLHLDTSMKLGDDPAEEPLSNEKIAERGAILYKACEEAFQNRLRVEPNAVHPVFVIGSEVPIPGGAQKEKATVAVTSPEDFEATLVAYKKKFVELGLSDAWEHIIAVVVQPGVEFGNATIHHYNRLDSLRLCECLKKYPDIVFEGHSTDYQAPAKLREMVEDGIAIIKVGPALTFALREALFSLSMMEKELILDSQDRANFIEVLDAAMEAEPKHWEKYYHGTAKEKRLCRRYSFSDRSRYYMALPHVEAAVEKLFYNLNSVEIPLNMLRQYMPLQYIKVRDGKLPCRARELAKDSVVTMVEDYNYAVKYNYMISGVFVR